MNTPLDLKKVKVFPLAQRHSDAQLDDILLDPGSNPPGVDQRNSDMIAECVAKVRAARERGASVMLIYGAHLIKNGATGILVKLMEQGWVTHLATNGAGIIHDWEFSYLGRSTESVRKNVATGTFGTWDETGRSINLAVVAGGIEGLGFGASLGKFIENNGVSLPSLADLQHWIKADPLHPLTSARAELLQMMQVHNLQEGRTETKHPWKAHSVVGSAYRLGIPFTVHPGIGYDIISNHPMFNGSAIGRGAELDFRQFGGAVEQLDGGVVLSVGSAIMGPQVFEKSISCVNNLRIQEGRQIVHDHTIYVVDLQDGGNWDWTKGEPPKENPAYYLRFCKSYARMGGAMTYLQCDNGAFVHNLLRRLT